MQRGKSVIIILFNDFIISDKITASYISLLSHANKHLCHAYNVMLDKETNYILLKVWNMSFLPGELAIKWNTYFHMVVLLNTAIISEIVTIKN